MFPDCRCGHPVAHRVQAERHRTAGTLQDSVGDGLKTAGDTQPAEPDGEVHPGQPGVVAGPEEFDDGNLLGIVGGYDVVGQIGDPTGGPIRVLDSAHYATIEPCGDESRLGPE